MALTLMAASKAGDEDGLRALLKGVVESEAPSFKSDMVLAAQLATRFGHAGRLLALLEAGLDVAAPSGVGAAMVMKATSMGDAACLAALIDAGAGLDWHNLGLTAAHIAALHGYSRCLELLIKAGADLEVASFEDKTPLHCAAMKGQAASVRLLLDAGVGLGARNARSWTPEQLAMESGHAYVADMLAAEVARREACAISEAAGPACALVSGPVRL